MGTHWDWFSATESLNLTVYGPWASQVAQWYRIDLPMQKTQETWIRKIPWSGKWLPTPVFLPGKFHGQSTGWATVHGVTKSLTWLVHWGKILRFSNMLRISALDLFLSWCEVVHEEVSEAVEYWDSKGPKWWIDKWQWCLGHLPSTRTVKHPLCTGPC